MRRLAYRVISLLEQRNVQNAVLCEESLEKNHALYEYSMNIRGKFPLKSQKYILRECRVIVEARQQRTLYFQALTISQETVSVFT